VVLQRFIEIPGHEQRQYHSTAGGLRDELVPAPWARPVLAAPDAPPARPCRLV
jgi:hypothetical protein